MELGSSFADIFFAAFFYTKEEMGVRVSLRILLEIPHSLNLRDRWHFGSASQQSQARQLLFCRTTILIIYLGAFGGLIAFGVQHAHAAIHSWRILFIVEVPRPSLCSLHFLRY
jgi:hypothetical protein